PSVPEACAKIVARAMAKAPADRYENVGAMLADLQVVAGTLSGQTAIALPSDTAIRSAAPTGQATATGAAATGAAPSRRLPALLGGVGLAALAAVILLLWRPWHKDEATPPPGPPTGAPIKVGVLHSLSGTMAASGTVVVDATLFAIEEINAAGGLLGRPVKAI